MLTALKSFTDRLLGRGSAAITVPVMDGLLLPNRALDQAAVAAELPGIDDLAWDGQGLWASAGPVLWRLDGDRFSEQRRFDADITALAISRHGRFAVALGGRQVLVLAADGAVQATLDKLAGQPLCSINALAWDGEDALLLTDGSHQHAPAQWCHDLMTLGHSGRAARWWLGSGEADLLADGLAYAYGVLPGADGVLVSESWQHRVVKRAAGAAAGRGPGNASSLLAELPGYPSRMTPAADGGFWLSCFVCRTQLVEFVLREPAYRQRMVAEIDPRYWIAPALSSGHSFLEPLQGAGVKQMGVMKPWAPPRSYGLVLKVSANGRIQRSLHSQVDGRHHGITALAEHGGQLYAASKGSGRLLRVDLHPVQGEEQ
jgi:sugar lactone lactonase YvrE